MVAGILPLAAPATPAGAQLDNAMSARRGGDGGAQVEPWNPLEPLAPPKSPREWMFIPPVISHMLHVWYIYLQNWVIF